MCVNYGLTGVMARCTGLKRDLRFDRMETYANYYHLNFRGYIGQKGDSFDRYLLRMNEMTESLNIINQVVYKLTKKKSLRAREHTNLNPHQLLQYITPDAFNKTKKRNSYNNMEQLIKHFKYWSEGFPVASGYTYRAVESPKGEFGVTLFSDGTNKPYKCKVRSPAYHHLQVLPKLSRGYFLADLATLIGTIDIVFGEIDR